MNDLVEGVLGAIEDNPDGVEKVVLTFTGVICTLVARRGIRRGLEAFGLNEVAAKRTPALLAGVAFVVAYNAAQAKRLSEQIA